MILGWSKSKNFLPAVSIGAAGEYSRSNSSIYDSMINKSKCRRDSKKGLPYGQTGHTEVRSWDDPENAG